MSTNLHNEKNEPNPSRNDYKDDLWEMHSPEERTSIEKGLEDMKKGKVVPHEEVRKLYEKY